MAFIKNILLTKNNKAANKRSHKRPLRGLDLNRCAGFGLCCER